MWCFKIGINHEICTNLLHITNIETGIYKLSDFFFSKIDLKPACNQLQIDDIFKGITTINNLILLLRWMRMSFGVKTASDIFQKERKTC